MSIIVQIVHHHVRALYLTQQELQELKENSKQDVDNFCTSIHTNPSRKNTQDEPMRIVWSIILKYGIHRRGITLKQNCVTFVTKGNRKNDFFITTPIFYVNAAPHIGHLYSAVIADAACRFQKLLGCENSLFTTGTDEHGLKIQQASAASGLNLSEYCTTVSNDFRKLFDKCDVRYTDFIRTTEKSHREAVYKFWSSLKDKDYIYEGSYSGWYCIPEESFLTETQLKEVTLPDGRVQKVSVESGHPVEWIEEKNYMFRLKSLQDSILHWLKDENVVRPLKFHRMLTNWVEEGLQDLSVSRPKERIHWGIPVPGDPTQTIYVWLDALVNYLTVGGYAKDAFTWPVDLHIIGKDILKFHGIYWPAFLIAAGLEPPRCLLCHSHWMVDGEKMSKSKGNVVDPFDRVERYGASGLRYFLLREGVPHSDGNYSDTKIMRILNAELADTLGNLLSRCCAPSINSCQVFPAFNKEAFEIYCKDQSEKLMNSLTELPDIVKLHFSEYNFYKGIDGIISSLHLANQFVQEQKPWELKKAGKQEHLDIVLHITLEALRVCGILLQPIVPQLSDSLLGKLGISPDRRKWPDIRPFSWEKDEAERNISKEKVILYNRLQSS